MREGKQSFEKKNPKYLSWWPEPTEEEIIRLCLCHTIFKNFKVACNSNKKVVCILIPGSYFFLVACFCS